MHLYVLSSYTNFYDTNDIKVQMSNYLQTKLMNVIM